jgi:hypothetical protein
MPLPSFLTNLSKRTLPNGGGAYQTANSTPSGFSAPDTNNFDLTSQVPSFTSPVQAPQQPQTPQTPQPQEQPIIPPNVMTGTQDAPLTQEEQIKLQTIAQRHKTPVAETSNDLYDKWLQERESGTGLYAVPKDVTLTPDQIFGLRSMADDHYASMLSAVSAREKSAAKTSSVSDFSSDPAVNSLVASGLIAGGTAGERDANAKRLMALPEDQKKMAINTIAYQKLGPTQKENYTSNEQASQLGQYALTLLDPDMVNNPYKYTANNYITYLGGAKDPKYTNFMQNVQSVIAPIRKSFFGASLTPGEQKAANQFLPDPSTDDMKTIAMKLRNVNSIAQFTNDVMISNILGTPRPKVADYITINADGTPKKTNTGGFAEEW